ncbi:glycoside hydrolase [Dactylonectria estremocensis]|uniref:Glycoside hydrolase n=1 Tax=Dactylonectria estremocensis TaxID=1079267 RepID=A0A9P9JBG2_9HYPO|nr:glycoside hydrolase [Dactylonectria estremocensis]
MLHDFPWGGLIARASFVASTQPRAADAQTYVDRAYTGIERLNSDWYDAATGIWDSAWWNSANALTVLADFTTLRLDEANELNIGGIMRTTFNNAQKTQVQTIKTMNQGLMSSVYCIDSSEGCMSKRDFIGKRGFDDFENDYYDDEGWWALAWIRSYDASGTREYLDMAVSIFEDMQTASGSDCSVGVYWSKDRKYVNAITNELYLTVAASLARRVPSNSAGYLEIAERHWNWFSKSGMINDDDLINDGLTSSDCENNGLQTWTYNQGVILGGLVELYLATGHKFYLVSAAKIAKAAINGLTNDGGILVETDDCETSSSHCGTDGQQFKGVFIRNLRYLHAVAPQDSFKSFILKNADSIWKNDRDSSNRLGVAWAGPYVDATGPSHSSALDAIVAAIAVADN